MSRLTAAIDAVEQSLADLQKALSDRAEHVASAEAQQQNQYKGSLHDEAANGIVISDDELLAMKSELQEAMSLVKEIQAPDQVTPNQAAPDAPVVDEEPNR